MTFRASVIRDERGVTLIELMVSMLLLAFVSAAVVTGMTSAMRSADLHRDDDRAVQDLRLAKERLTRELRAAAELQAASGSSITVWIDQDADGDVDPGEVVMWEITGAGALNRSTDTTPASAVVVNLDATQSEFAFDAEGVDDIRLITVVLVARVGTSDGTRSMQTQILLRNAT